jgi:exodeoxyribonuclease-3
MPTFKIATWNVNSLRVRLPHVLNWLREHQPDVLALQELKMSTEDFPMAEIESMGYHAIVSGQRTYNGVAVLSKKLSGNIVTDIPELEDHQRRVLCVTVDDVRILNLYVPNGQSVGSEKYLYKLNWLKHLDIYLKHEIKSYPKMIVLGDFNIAPEEIDVYDPKRWEDSVLFSDKERKAFQDMLQVGFVDCFRMLSPQEKSYSWWDYRLNAFKRNMGLRIDHILATPPLSTSCEKCYIDKTPRNLERPSDHAPVVAEFSV